MRGKSDRRMPSGWNVPGFNEARALCAGSPGQLTDTDSQYMGFNEARALCAGSLRGGQQHLPARLPASMRPAHYAREVAGVAAPSCLPCRASMRPAHYAREVGNAEYPMH